METKHLNGGPASGPSREEAASALREAERVRSRMREGVAPVPRWFFPALAVCLAGLSLAQLLPGAAMVVVTAALAAALGVSVGAASRASAYTPRTSPAVLGAVMAAFVAAVVGAMALDRAYGHWWAWCVLAALGAGLALTLGALHGARARKQAG